MCGIFGCVGKNNVVDMCLDGLKKLEYRGYDSSGIAYFYKNDIKIVKKTGKICNLEREIKKLHIKSNCAIMHTRWATHGEVCDLNAHPHTNKNKTIALVHNGIIENYNELKNEYKFECVSQTDSEVIAYLIENSKKKNNLEKIKDVCSLLVGSYALAVVFSDENNKIYVAKNKSPVVVGHMNNCSYVCSDANALSDFCNSVNILNDKEFAILTSDSVEIFDYNLQKISAVNISIISNKTKTVALNYPHFMLKEICEVPLSIVSTVENNNFYVLDNIFKKLKFNSKTKFILIGCGTAYHACLLGEKYLSELNFEARCYVASEFRYEKIKLNKNTIAIFVSQSGETADTLACVEKCKNHKLKTLAITNVMYSSISKQADEALYTYAGTEIAVASTKAYNSQLTMLLLIRNYLKNIKKSQNNALIFEKECKNIKNSTKYLMNNDLLNQMKYLAKKYKKINHFFLIGRLKDQITAREGALKIKEITYKHCEGYASGELKHGSIALIDNSCVVICFATNKKMLQKSLVALEEVACRGAKTILVTLDSFNLDFSKFDEVIKIKKVKSEYQELISIEVMQLFSYYLCVELRLDPDKPRNLAKSVTVE